MSISFNLVVLAGGVGSRLWPLSRLSYPKQFQKLLNHGSDLTMLQQTFHRIAEINCGSTQVICNQDHRFLVAEQCRAANINSEIVLEPSGRNTGPALILAALRLIENDTDDPMLVLSADHYISDKKSFLRGLTIAHDFATMNNIVTIGIEPSYPCTGYGYICSGTSVGQGFEVVSFEEKPEELTAKDYISKGNYFWNSGVFVVRPSVLIQEAELYCKELLDQCRLVFKSITKDLDFIRLPEDDFLKCQSISIDYAIMENTKKAIVVPTDCGWSDIGDFQALWKANIPDENSNVLQGDVLAVDCRESFIKSENRLVSVIGVEGLAVIETKDAVLVTSLNKAQQVRDIVEKLKDRNELNSHRQVYRPWGNYDCIDSGNNYQVKRITVNPGARLSLQRHKYRAEHWVVVEGTAKVHVDGVNHILNPNDSIYIPLGAVHCLENESEDILHLVEVQSGSYLGEDDIERLEDLYGRD